MKGDSHTAPHAAAEGGDDEADYVAVLRADLRRF